VKILSAPSSADTTKSELDEQKVELVAIRALLAEMLANDKTSKDLLLRISGAKRNPLTGELVLAPL